MAEPMKIGSFGMKPFQVMDPKDANAIHTNSLHLLESMGIKVVSDEGRRLLKEAGAEVEIK